jgi:hypothetical protein
VLFVCALSETVREEVAVVVVDVETVRCFRFGGGFAPRHVVVLCVVTGAVAVGSVVAVNVASVVLVAAVVVCEPLVVSFGDAATPPPAAENPAAAIPTAAVPAARRRTTRLILWSFSVLAPA